MPMNKSNSNSALCPEQESTWSMLEEVLRKGAQKMLQVIIDQEVDDFVKKHTDLTDTNGHRLVVKNGYKPERNIITGIGPIAVKPPRVDDRKLKTEPNKPRFTSEILPRYLRRVPSIDNLIPVLYLKGISTGDFPEALESIIGCDAAGLSPSTVTRLKLAWEDEYKKWATRDLSQKEYIYFWVDGIYSGIRLEDDKACILTIIAADSNGNKELLAVEDGLRESKISWHNLLLDLKKRGLEKGPKLAIGDGALGFWAALREVYPATREQRCWVHKTANMLDKLPKSIQPKAKSVIQEMYMADTKKNALAAYTQFISAYGEKYPKAVACLEKDKDQLFIFYDFPGIHWIHIRTTNPIESTFATIRQRTYRTKNCGNRITTLTMFYKLGMESEKNWHKLKGHNLIPFVMAERKFIDGVMQEEAIKNAG